jgi:hypothetical protein
MACFAHFQATLPSQRQFSPVGKPKKLHSQGPWQGQAAVRQKVVILSAFKSNNDAIVASFL